MYIDSAARPRETEISLNGSELAEGLMLLRASTLKLIRLQLAIARQDRRVALEAMDDLVSLDARLQDYLDAVPATREQVMLRRELDYERAALNSEKLTLAAEIVRGPADPAKHADGVDQRGMIKEDDWLGPRESQVDPDDPRPTHWRLAVGVLPLLGLAVGACFVSYGDAASWFATMLEAVR